MMSQSQNMHDLVAQARTVQARLTELWADEGVEQLSIFLDPEIVVILEEIKLVSMGFIEQVAALTGEN